MLDSGANFCFCSAETVSTFGLELNTTTTHNVKLANRTSQRSLGTTTAPLLSVDGIRWTGPFVVLPNISNHHFILGMPWLRDAGACIDFRSRHVDYRSTKDEQVEIDPAKPRRPPPAEHVEVDPAKPRRPPLAHNVVCRDQPAQDDHDDTEIAMCHADFSALNEAASPDAEVELFSSAAEPLSPSDSTDGRPTVNRSSDEFRNTFAPGESEDKPQRHRLALELFKEFRDVFPDELPDGLPPQRSADFSIKLANPQAKPPSKAPYAMSVPELDQLKKDLDEWKRKGWIRVSESPYGAPCAFVRKSDSSRRLVIDYRLLNQNTVRDEAGLPLPDELFNRLQGSQFWTKLDLRSGYYQIRINPADVHKTAFRCRFGHYEWNVLPFGLTNAPSFFMRMMTEALHPMLDSSVVCFLDDILVYSRTLEEHKQHLKQVLRTLRSHKFYAKLSKCSLVASEVTFLGHCISRQGIAMELSKTESIFNWPRPRTVRELMQWLGLCNFYRKHIKDFAKIAALLSDMLRKKGDTALKSNSKLEWTDATVEAFDTLRHAFQQAPMLISPDSTRPFVLHTDASDFAIGATLGQEVPGEGIRPIAFFSKKLIPAETRYPVHDRELLAIVRALQAFRHLLDGAPVTIVTDHSALTHFFTQPHLTSRQLRWSLFLSQFNAKLKYEPGRNNIVADALSRRPDHADPDPAPVFIDRHSPEAADYAVAHALDLVGGDLAEEVIRAQQEDEMCKRIVQDPRCPDNSRLQLRYIDGALYHEELLFVPADPKLKSKLLFEAHDSPTSGHGGEAKTLWQIMNFYWWPHMRAEVANYVSHCNRCQHIKASTRPPFGKLQPLPRPHNAWSDIAIDFIGPLPVTEKGNNALMVVVDRASKYAHFIPTTTQATGEDVWQLLLHHVVRLHGLPVSIVSDRDTRFTGRFWRGLQSALQVNLRMSSAYHPQTDGQVERLNRILEDHLRCYVSASQDDWDTKLDTAELCYNTSYQSAIGTSPHMYLTGQKARTPFAMRSQQPPQELGVPSADEHLQRIIQAQELAHKFLDQATEHMVRTANKRRTPAEHKVGDQVLLDTHSLRLPVSTKFKERWIGPFEITQVINPGAYRLKLPSTWRIFDVINVSRLKAYKSPGDSSFPGQPDDHRPPPVSVDEGAPDDQHYEIESILKSRKKGRRTEYLVKWRGYSQADNSWVDSKELNAPELLSEFNRRNVSALASASVDDPPQAEVAAVDTGGGHVTHPEMDRVWATVQCRARTKAGKKCQRRTRRGGYCWQHLTQICNLRIKKSGIPGAGLGVYTGPKPISRYQPVADYDGPIVRSSDDQQAGGDYALQLTKDSIIAGGKSTNVGSFVNDCLPNDRRLKRCTINARLSTNPRTKRARLVSTKRIPPNTEVTASYGHEYWKNKRAEAARRSEAAQGRFSPPKQQPQAARRSEAAQGRSSPPKQQPQQQVSYAHAHRSSLPHLDNFTWS